MLLGIILLLTFYESTGLRTPDTWDNVFRSNSRGKFTSSSHLQDRLVSYLSEAHSHKSHPFIARYPDNCGHICHDILESQIRAEKSSHYSIINSDHALVYTDLATMNSLRSSHGDLVLDFVPFLPELKVDTDVDLDGICSSETEVAVNVVFLPFEIIELQQFQQSFSDQFSGYNYLAHELNLFLPQQENILTLRFSCDDAPRKLQQLTERSDVQWIERYYTLSTKLRWANGISQSGKQDKTPIFHANLTGHGQVIGIADTGIDVNSCFFLDETQNPFVFNKINTKHRKIVLYSNSSGGGNTRDDAGHGTSVAGAASGKCYNLKSNYYDYYGSAYDSKIAFIDIGTTDAAEVTPPANYYAGIFSPLYAAGSKIQTMSWGSTSNSYTTGARYIDQFMWDNKDSLIFVAAGNSGEAGDKTVGSPATNKNGVAVGASLNDEQAWNANGKVSTKDGELTKAVLARFSSRGPTADGRLKPELCAVGSNLGSAENKQECKIVLNDGTSFSSPLTAGYAALVRQYFLDGFYPSGYPKTEDSLNPSGALVKAILVHSGQQLDSILDTKTSMQTSQKTSFGDTNQGYGRIQLNTALSFNIPATRNGLTMFVIGSATSGNNNYVEITKTNEVHQYHFTTRSDSTSVKITLAYTDYYGTVGSIKPLVNDLDVYVIFNGNISHVPIITNSYDDILKRRYDSKNNLEHIRFDSCPNCNYTVVVKGRSISKAQPYALVITGLVGQYTYSNDYNGVASGLTQKAKILVIVTACLAFCLTAFVAWIAFGRPVRRLKINEVKALYKKTPSMGM